MDTPDTPHPYQLDELWLVRHGETEWSRDHKHTSVTELPLTDVGTEVAHELAGRLKGVEFDQVLSSPRLRALRTAEICGFTDPEIDEDLVEWDYGEYEGITTVEIRKTVPGWTVWSHHTPGGESAEQVTERLDRVVERVREHPGKVLIFGHGHALRALAARWLGRPVGEGRHYVLGTATLSVLGYERDTPAIVRWNG